MGDLKKKQQQKTCRHSTPVSVSCLLLAQLIYGMPVMAVVLHMRAAGVAVAASHIAYSNESGLSQCGQ